MSSTCLVSFSQCLVHFRAHVAPDMPSVKLELKKNLPIGSGLGSSACSVVATFAALDKFAQTNLSQVELIELMADFEAESASSSRPSLDPNNHHNRLRQRAKISQSPTRPEAASSHLDEKLRQAYFWIVNYAIISPYYDMAYHDGNTAIPDSILAT